MKNPNLISFPYIYKDDVRYIEKLNWIKANASGPKWKYSRKKGKYYPSANNTRVLSATLIGVYLTNEDAIAYSLKFVK